MRDAGTQLLQVLFDKGKGARMNMRDAQTLLDELMCDTGYKAQLRWRKPDAVFNSGSWEVSDYVPPRASDEDPHWRYDIHLTHDEREAIRSAGFICLSDELPPSGEWVQLVTDIRSEPPTYDHRRAISRVIGLPRPDVIVGLMVRVDGPYPTFTGNRRQGYIERIDYPTHWKKLDPLPYAVPPDFPTKK